MTTEVDAEGTVTYTYDSGGELLTATGSRTESYSYDSDGNRTMTGYTTGTGNELTASPGYTYTYDNAGNMIAPDQHVNACHDDVCLRLPQPLDAGDRRAAPSWRPTPTTP